MSDLKDASSGRTSPVDLGPHPKPKAKRNKFAILCAILASMSSILLGYADIAVMSGAVIFIKDNFKLSEVQVEILVGIINFYSLIGAAVAGRTSDLIGRRYTMVLAGVIFFVAAVLMGFAPNYGFLMFGRFVAGIGIGYALMIAPVYTTEVAPTSSRGFFTSFSEVFINVGVLLGYVSNYAFFKLPTHLGWRFMLGIGVFPSAFLVLIVLLMPESPRWLVMQGCLAHATSVLLRTSDSPHEAQLRLAHIKQAAGIPPHCTDDVIHLPKRSRSGKDVWKDLFLRPTPTVRHILISAIGIHFFQQATGIDGIMLYSPRIFEHAGLTSSNHKILVTMAIGFTKTIFILVAMFLLDRIGRRPLLLTSVTGKIV
ncbi:putative polyol transporter 2 [Cucurbita argyrosperma subsp. argyrosperma]|nr:putative polyol transporter 2 [Cucurbita argyrosperma subsp. argyrosperma]